MVESILIGKPSPFCPGCGHSVVTHDLGRALEELGVDPLDTIVVSDIGCCGIVDGLLTSHTVHGLHGRSPALALGITLGLNNPRKKVIVIQGDGGATIGLQHVLEAARQNVDLTLLILNNMVYGMTGGQISGLSATEFKADRFPEARKIPPYDICQLAHNAGAAFSCRTFVGKKLLETLKTAIETEGFSLVEVIDMCPSHGVRKLKDLQQLADYPEASYQNHRTPFRVTPRETVSLLQDVEILKPEFKSSLEHRLRIILAGSAGEGIQLAGDLLAAAGMLSGLYCTKKGEYPITVGTGFSIAEIILSRDPVHYTGIDTPDLLFILSPDGLAKVKDRITATTRLIIDESLAGEVEQPPFIVRDFRGAGGKKGAALLAVYSWLKQSKLLPPEALKSIAEKHRKRDNLLRILQKEEMPTPEGD
ncbi:MAG: hypothetical protein D6748_05970 [Calditrichaeota bacterium]|nr:MAG: hypothetical protein D6748_05970 [Calditrichota bacterium]